MTAYKIFDADVLVIGSGGAGLRAAIEAHDSGSKVIILSKSVLGKAHTVMAEGGIAAALGNIDISDNWKAHFRDTMVEGQLINDWRMVKALVQEVPERIRELEEWGVIFDRTPNGKIAQRLFGAHTYKRTCYVGDRIGLELLHTLEDHVIERDIEILDETFVTKIFKTKGKVTGVVGVDLKNGEIFAINAKAVILATGGAGRVYKITSNSWETTGHGYALAYEAGAELQDMEMIQFHPTGMVYPESVAGMLVTEAIRGEGGILLNKRNERFMKKYDPKRMELGPRDIVARAIYNEIKEGRSTVHGGVWLDITQMGSSHIMHKLPRMYSQFKEYADIDITKERMEVAPTVHYMMGGIRTSTDCTTSVPGLFVAGEASAGVHGANRLGGNSLADILVFGKRAGASAAKYAVKKPRREVPSSDIGKETKRIEAPFKSKGQNPASVKAGMQEIMWEHAGIVRTKAGLQRALAEIEKLMKIKVSADGDLQYNHSWLDAIQIYSMLTVCESVIRSAIQRTESRGAHFREDFPKRNDKEWMKNIVCKNILGKMKVSAIAVPRMPRTIRSFLI